MTLNELKYIVALARERHFGHAAEACFVSQPTLSVAVKKIEDELGVVIFERTKHDVRLTHIGETLVEQAQHIIDEVEVFKNISEHGRDQLSSAFRVGAIFTVGPYLFPHLVVEMNQQIKKMPLVLYEDYTSRLKSKLRDGEVDAIIIGGEIIEPGIDSIILATEPFYLLMNQNHPLADCDAIDGSMLNEHNVLLLGEGHCFRDQVLEACPGCVGGARLNKKQRITDGSSLETLRYMVLSGLGVTVLPKLALGGANGHPLENHQLVAKPINQELASRKIVLAWRRGYPRPQAIEVLKQTVLQSLDIMLNAK